MIQTRHKQVLQLAVRAGEIMMKSGAEIYRVEDTVRRICQACKIPVVECFAIATGIFVSIDAQDEESDVYTMVKRVSSGSTNLHKLSAINDFSRAFTTTDMSIDSGLKRLEEIDKYPLYPLALRFLGAALVSAFYCGIFSGSLASSLCASLIGLVSYSLSVFLNKYDTNYFIKGFCCCASATILAVLTSSLGIASDYGSMVIGTMMLFVPGSAITNSIRDLLSGDMVSGVSRMSEAFVVALSLASGSGLIIAFWSIIGLYTAPSIEVDHNLLVEILFGFAPTLGFSILLHVPKSKLIPAALVGSLSWATYLLSASYGSGDIMACFFGACLVGFLSGFASRFLKEASTVFIIPGIMPMVPGAGMYYTMLALISGDYSLAASTGSKALFMAGAIALGVMVSGGFFKISTAIGRKISS